VSLWIPSLGGRFDPENTVHDMAMTITGGLSKPERQHVQRRVRAAMAAQVLIDGRYQGGRPPYGYVVVDGGPHPHPRKAQEGQRLRCLAIDEFAAAVVRRIFDLYLEGWGKKAIAKLLNREGVSCAVGARAAAEPLSQDGYLAALDDRHHLGQSGTPSTVAGRRSRSCWIPTMWPRATL
jgi:hypothetical protein